jgi:hypothetical protein
MELDGGRSALFAGMRNANYRPGAVVDRALSTAGYAANGRERFAEDYGDVPRRLDEVGPL